MTIHPTAASGFSRAARDYLRGRPSYPADAVAWLADRLDLGPGRTVVDLGAGTGALTRLLVETGARVVAVEPVTQMRAALAAVAGVDGVDGTAEAIPLADGSVHAVTAAQAFHWFDGEAALREIARVLVPGGGLGLIWNSADESSPLQAAMIALVHRHRPAGVPAQRTQAWRRPLDASPLFTRLEAFETRSEQELDADGYVARIASTSYVAALPDAAHAAVLDEARAIVADQPARFRVPYRTFAYACRRR